MSRRYFFFELNFSQSLIITTLCSLMALCSLIATPYFNNALSFHHFFPFLLLLLKLLFSLFFFLSNYHRVFAETSQSTFPGRSPSRCDWSAALPSPSRQTGDLHTFPSASWETAACFQSLAHSPPACSNL